MRSFKLLLSAFVLFFAITASAQWTSVTNLINTTQNYGGVNVAVTGSNGATTGGGCIGLYWIPGTNDYYDYAFSTPVSAVQLEVDALNQGESIEILINGQMFPIEDCNLDTTGVVGNCAVNGCNIVNGQFVNNTVGWVCGGKLTFYGIIYSLRVREPVGGSGTTFNISFAHMGTIVGGCNSQLSLLNEFSFSANKTCAGANIGVATVNYVSGMTVQTWYGDGSDDINTIIQGTGGGGYANFSHTYASSGNYTIKQVLYINNVATDSLQVNYEHHFCTQIPINFYADADNDCVYDNNEAFPSLGFRIFVDSNNVTIDTIPVTSGIYYKAYGVPGDVYDFTIIDLPGDLVPSCPNTGQVSVTLQNMVYYTNPYEMGVVCNTSNNWDLSVSPTLITAANVAHTYIYVGNPYCMPQNAILTYTFSPKYQFGYAWPAPTSVVGNTATWNLNGVNIDNMPYIHAVLPHNGVILTPGDTVHTTISITPTTGDVDVANNLVISEDTVTGPFDPNAIYVAPSSCVQPGTKLEYTVTFENLGNVPAQNIYVMDTISAGFDLQSMKIIGASHQMTITKIQDGGYNIFKFEFPNINLPGANDPARHGSVTYTLDMIGNFPIGSSVTNKAGIYFDYMPAVLTNVSSTTACWPTDVKTQVTSEKLSIYPNPANDKLNIHTSGQFTTYTISNSIGQVQQVGTISAKQATLDIRTLPAGVYSIKLEGDRGTEVRSFVKM